MEKNFEPNRLLDRIAIELKVRSDKQLAKKLGLDPAVLAEIRRRCIPVTATLLLHMQQLSGMPVDTLRALMGDRRRRIRATGLPRRPARVREAAPDAIVLHRQRPADATEAYGYRRKNHVHAAYVDAALKLTGKIGTGTVAHVLRMEGVDEAVVERVLHTASTNS